MPQKRRLIAGMHHVGLHALDIADQLTVFYQKLFPFRVIRVSGRVRCRHAHDDTDSEQNARLQRHLVDPARGKRTRQVGSLKTEIQQD